MSHSEPRRLENMGTAYDVMARVDTDCAERR